jgi:pyruvate,water dikinase
MSATALQPEPRILWIGDRGSENAALVGGKAAALGRLAQSYPVPPGFCITAFIPVEGAALPYSLADRVRAAYRQLADRCAQSDLPVAVRSSAVDEDGQRASFAGLHETYLNVQGADAVVEAVDSCVQSATSPSALAYRERHELTTSDIRVAVLVQQMVPADVSFVAFSSNPLSFGEDEVVITAAWGLGESVVRGTVVPDTYVIRRSDRIVTQRVCGQQTSEVRQARAGTPGVVTVRRHRAECSLSESDVQGVFDLVVRLEREMGHPVDVEGARVGDALFVLQCRPITVRFPVVWQSEQDRIGSWLREDIHFPNVVSPLGGDYACKGMYTGLARMQEELNWPSRGEARVFNGYVYVNWLYLVTHEPLQKAREELTGATLARSRHIVDDWHSDIRPRLLAVFDGIDSAPFDTASAAEAAALWKQIWDRVAEAWTLHFVLLYPCLAAARHLAAVCATVFEHVGPHDALRLTQGRAVHLHQVEVDLYSLSRTALAVPGLAPLLTREPRESYRLVLNERTADPFIQELGRVVAAHGHLGPESDDLGAATWSDEPWRLLPEVRRIMASDESPAERRNRLLAESDAYLAQLRHELRGRERDQQRFEVAVALARTVSPWIEDHNYAIDRMLHAKVRACALRVGERLQGSGAVEDRGDVFFLRAGEIVAQLEKPENQRALVARRREDMREFRELRPPKFLTNQPGTDPCPPEAHGSVDAEVIRGTPASVGVGRGPVRVIRSSEEIDRVRQGDVLVCHNTNLSWISAIPLVSAVIASTGGMLSHAAILSREFRVPAVVGVGGATDLLSDDTVVEVDGGAGTVRIQVR